MFTQQWNLGWEFSARQLVPAALLAVALLCGARAAPAQQFAFRISLDGQQSVPPTASVARGCGYAVMDPVANTLQLRLTFTDLSSSEVAAEIRGFAPAGSGAPAVFALPLGNTKTAQWDYPQALEQQILDSLACVSVSSSNFPGGEIRGQIVRDAANAFLTLQLDGAHAVPPSASSTRGSGWLSLDALTHTLSYGLTYHGLVGTESASHIHGFVAPPFNGAVLFDLPLGSTKFGVLPVTSHQENFFPTGLAYVCVRSDAYPFDEIRGQALPGPRNPIAYCSAKLNSKNCTPIIQAEGLPSVTAVSGFTLYGLHIRNHRSGVLIYGLEGGQALPFTGGTLCVAGTLNYATALNSRGSPPPADDCSGFYSIDMAAFAHGALGGTPHPELLQSGTIVNCQFFGRDPGFAPPNDTTLTNALQYQIP